MNKNGGSLETSATKRHRIKNNTDNSINIEHMQCKIELDGFDQFDQLVCTFLSRLTNSLRLSSETEALV